MAERISKRGLRKLAGPVERQMIFDIHAEAADSELDSEDEELRTYDSIIRKQLEASNDLNDFIANLEERKEDMKPFHAFKLDARLLQLLEKVPNYDPETVEVLNDIRHFGWDRVQHLLEESDTNDPQEEMYLNRLRTQSKKRSTHELADFALDHYRQKKQDYPDRVKAFESAAKKVFGAAELHEYQEVLAELEILSDDVYREELSRLLEPEGVEGASKEAYDELRDVLTESESPDELAAYTQDRIEFFRDREPEVSEEMRSIVMDKFEAVLPTKRIQ